MIDCLITLGLLPERITALPLKTQDKYFAVWCRELANGLQTGLRHQGEIILFGAARLHEKTALAQALHMDAHASDLELLFAAWARWGQDCPTHLYGDWLLLSWQPRKGQGWLAYDANGNIPWFYHCDSHGMRIATSIPLLLEAGAPCILNESALAQNILAPVDATKTPYQDIYAIPVGHTVQWEAGKVSSQRWWYPEHTPRLRCADRDAYLAAFRACYDQIIADSLPPQASAALMLSSGYDSNSIAAVAAPMLAKRAQTLLAYSLEHRYPVQSYGRRFGDELSLARASAEHIGNIEFNPCSGGKATLAQTLANMVSQRGLPHGHSNAIWMNAMTEAAKQAGAGILLHGKSGNMTVSWRGLGEFWQPLKQGDWQQVRHVMGSRPAHWKIFLREQFARPIGRTLWHPIRRRLHLKRQGEVDFIGHKNKLLAPEMACALQKHPAIGNAVAQFKLQAANPKAWRLKLITQRIGSGCYEYGAKHQIPTTDPTADRRIVEFCYSVPDWVYWSHGKGRGLIRDGFKGELPDCILDDKLRGLQSSDLCARIAAEQTEILACLARFARHGLIRKWLNLPYLENLVKRIAAGEKDWLAFAEAATLLNRGLVIGFFLERFTDAESDA